MYNIETPEDFIDYLAIKKRKQRIITWVLSLLFVVLLVLLVCAIYYLSIAKKEISSLALEVDKTKAELALQKAELEIYKLEKEKIGIQKESKSEITNIRDSLKIYKNVVQNQSDLVKVQNELVKTKMPLVFLQYMPQDEYRKVCSQIAQALKRTGKYRVQAWEKISKFSFNSSIKYSSKVDENCIKEITQILESMNVKDIKVTKLPDAEANSIEIWIGRIETKNINVQQSINKYLTNEDVKNVEKKVEREFKKNNLKVNRNLNNN